MQGLLSHPDFPLSYPKCIEVLLEGEAAKLLAATSEVDVRVALGRFQLLEHLLHWPARLALMNKDYYDDRAKRDRATAARPDESAYHLGSPYYRADFARRAAERAASPLPSPERAAGR